MNKSIIGTKQMVVSPHYLASQAQGGEGQPQTQTAIITRMLDYGMHPQQAINEPRWVWGPDVGRGL